MLNVLIDRISLWASVSSLRAALLRYLGTVLAMAAVIALSVLVPLGDNAWIAVIVVVLGCAWFGGVGPAILAPILLMMSIRIAQKSPGEILDFSSKEIVDLAVFLLLTVAVGWSGQVRRRAEAVVRRQALQLREEADRKDRFLAILSHELRNPLTPIHNGVETLRIAGDGSGDSALVRDVCDMMQRQVNQLVRLIDDLLDVSRVNTGKIELRREPVYLGDLVRDAVESSQPQIDAAGHRLEVTIHNADAVFEADRVRISQVLQNLLNNAAKFTPRGGHIQLSAATRDGVVELDVQDNGVGIPSDKLSQIFDIFAQLDDSRALSNGGLGIGLNIVRSLVEMHGGTVSAASPGVGQGSQLTVRLPLPSAEVAKSPARRSPDINRLQPSSHQSPLS